jgi:ankyrin repeat protein
MLARHAAVRFMRFERIVEHFGTRGLDVAAVRRYVDAGEDVNQRDGSMGWTLLHFAAENGNEGVIRLLVEHGADVRAADRNGWTALHVAADRDLDTSKRDGRPAVDLPTVRLLIEAGADESARTGEGWTARDIARDYKREDLYDLVAGRVRG